MSTFTCTWLGIVFLSYPSKSTFPTSDVTALVYTPANQLQCFDPGSYCVTTLYKGTSWSLEDFGAEIPHFRRSHRVLRSDRGGNLIRSLVFYGAMGNPRAEEEGYVITEKIGFSFSEKTRATL